MNLETQLLTLVFVVVVIVAVFLLFRVQGALNPLITRC